MQDNEFEKQVRDRLAHMQMDASDTVWQRVEEGLGEKRRRRRWLLWLPLSAAIMAGLVYLATETGNHYITDSTMADATGAKFRTKRSGGDVSADTVMHESGKSYSGRTNGRSNSLALSEGEFNDRKSDTVNAFDTPTIRARVKEEKLTFRGQTSGERTPGNGRSGEPLFGRRNPSERTSRERLMLERTSKEQRYQDHASHQKKPANAAFAKRTFPNPTTGDPSYVDRSPLTSRPAEILQHVGDEQQPGTTNGANTVSPAEKASNLKTASVTSDLPRSPEFHIADALQYRASPALPQLKGASIAAWRWGLVAGLGRSQLTSGNFGALAYSDVPNSPNYSAGNPTNPPMAMASSIKPALAWSLGGFVARQVDDAIYFKAGTQLTRLATSMRIGNYINQPIVLRAVVNSQDRSLASYYAAGNSQQHTNSYTFLDVPLALGFHFARRSRIPFAWELGVIPSFMLASDALHFNQSAGVYFKDNSLFKKSQFGLITSVPVSVYNGHKYALHLLPSLRYNTSNIFLAETNRNKHFLSAGIGLSATFKK